MTAGPIPLSYSIYLIIYYIIYVLSSARIKVPQGKEFCLFCSLINPKHLEQPEWQRVLNKYLLMNERVLSCIPVSPTSPF